MRKKYQIVFYSPDKHLPYNLEILNNNGIGGGITARVRMAHAFADLGHNVIFYANCPKDEIKAGVDYRHFSKFNQLETGIFIASSSGDGLNLELLCDIKINAKLKILMLHGVDLPNGFECLSYDYIYALSNFVREKMIHKWGINPNKIFCNPRGIVGEHYETLQPNSPSRDPFKLIYASHPSKGLDEAIKVIKILNVLDPRFSLHIYGGYELWGEEDNVNIDHPAITFHGLKGQRFLASEMMQSGFCLNLQDREEPFGILLVEAMRAGCIPIASNAGAYPEIISHSEDGFLVDNDDEKGGREIQAAKIIFDLLGNTQEYERIMNKTISKPLDWNTIAQSWVQHWDWANDGVFPKGKQKDVVPCSLCDGKKVEFTDGSHCVDCGNFILRTI